MNSVFKFLSLMTVLVVFSSFSAAVDAIEIVNDDPDESKVSEGYASGTVEFRVWNDTATEVEIFYRETGSDNYNDQVGSLDENDFDGDRFVLEDWNTGTELSDDNYDFIVWETGDQDNNATLESIDVNNNPPGFDSQPVAETFENGNVTLDWSHDVVHHDENVVWRNDTGDGSSDFEIVESGSTSSSFEDSDTDFTNYDYIVELRDHSGLRTNSTEISVEVEDGVAPEIVDRYPAENDLINDDEPEILVELVDDLSGVAEVNLTLWDDDGELIDYEFEEDNQAYFDVELGEEEYTVNATFEDSEGNWGSEEWSFEVDVTPPDTSTDLVPDPDDAPYITTSTSIVIDLGDGSDIYEAECYAGNPDGSGEEFGSDDDVDDEEVDCGTLDPDDYSDGDQSIYIQVYDEAGNRDSWEVGEYVFDTSSPVIGSVSVDPEFTNEAPNITVEATDMGSGLSTVEYSFQSFDGGDGTEAGELSGNSDELVFEPDMSGKSDDVYDLYVRVQDNLDNWSSEEEIEFTYDPDAEPTVSVDHDVLEIEEGEDTDFEVTVENEDEVPVSSASLSFDGAVSGESDEFEVEGKGQRTVFVDVSAEEEYGVYDTEMVFESSLIQDEFDVEVRVLADDDTVEELSNELERKESELNALRSNLTELEQAGASSSILEDLEIAVSEFETSYMTAESAADNNTYYSAASEFSQLEDLSATAFETLNEVEQEHRSSVFRKRVMILGGVIVVSLAGIAGFFVRNEEYDLEQFIEGRELDLGFMNGVMERVQGAVNSAEEEAESFEWDGFES